MAVPTTNPSTNTPNNIVDGIFSPPESDGLFLSGYDPNNIIIQGSNNRIEDCRRCTIINGASNYIYGKYNTHVIGDQGNVVLDNAFYVACVNGLHCDGDVVAYSSSDMRLKDNITPISGCLQKLEQVDGVEFNWNNNQETHSGHDIGLIAQQVQQIAPEIVTERKNGYLGVKYEKMVPILVGAIKEQQSLIKEMRAEIDELKEKIIR